MIMVFCELHGEIKMTLREKLLRDHPDFPLLELNDRSSLAGFLIEKGWLGEAEQLLSCEKPGEGNMNLTMRVVTNRRRFILKQARPWVEKYDHIPAPSDRITYERRFYERVASIPDIRDRMPRLMEADSMSRTIVLEDLEGAADMTWVYRGDRIDESALESLGHYLHTLHSSTSGQVDPAFANRDMRALNHQHIFEIPLAEDCGLELEKFEAGLEASASKLKADAAYVGAVQDLGRRYLADGPCLVHGDYFPGSWLQSKSGVFVTDPEFCFYGDPELDIGMATAHLSLGKQSSSARIFLDAATDLRSQGPDVALIARYAGVEIMRRIIGVAQLPLAPTDGFRAAMLERSRTAVLEGDLDVLCC